VNAVALYDKDDGTNYAMGSLAGRLCRFDAHKKECFTTPLVEAKPNVASILNDNY
jgi:hypothetical protein